MQRALVQEQNALSGIDSNNHQTTVSRIMRRITNRSNNHNSESSSSSSSMGGTILRKETKLGTVSIPSPGVPGDISVNLDQEVFSHVSDEEEEDDKKK